ncbi:hypothetical protein VOLCADRAFT_99246 [Volvox carteri f. nagariensis]|uniref:Uncharacterized protein n=1 Tax=Volvox carteri f. nagariensis TaxID=3068 RepID=D8UHB6_VOLCA|nr:uncharacterized protein VOLCADRAFT_99246 [Volvox carteri f. nagariensis]EFJ40902.1 hypothetical protein VOLCADRAFT_99246 [Volvox carteri f. nagariensis]|eukprot:XP_002958062.1 hypothetical protein VOLCADRAFT_99246 [Volvox carteri f. nagariensis]
MCKTIEGAVGVRWNYVMGVFVLCCCTCVPVAPTAEFFWDGVKVLPVQTVEWLQATVYLGHKTIKIKPSKTDYIFIMGAVWAKCKKDFCAKLFNGWKLSVEDGMMTHALQSMLGSIIGLYEVKTDVTLNKGLPGVCVQVLIEYLASQPHEGLAHKGTSQDDKSCCFAQAKLLASRAPHTQASHRGYTEGEQAAQQPDAELHALVVATQMGAAVGVASSSCHASKIIKTHTHIHISDKANMPDQFRDPSDVTDPCLEMSPTLPHSPGKSPEKMGPVRVSMAVTSSAFSGPCHAAQGGRGEVPRVCGAERRVIKGEREETRDPPDAYTSASARTENACHNCGEPCVTRGSRYPGWYEHNFTAPCCSGYN